jgi:hypothetical protein
LSILRRYFNREIGATEFTLHAFDAGLQILDSRDEPLHLQNLGRAEFHADVASLAVPLDDLDRWQLLFHLLTLLVVEYALPAQNRATITRKETGFKKKPFEIAVNTIMKHN